MKRERRNADSMHDVLKEYGGFGASGGTEKNIRDRLKILGSDPFIYA